MHRIILPIDTKSLYYNVLNDNTKGHTCTVATPIKQGKSINPLLKEVYKIPEQIDFEKHEQLIKELTKNSKSVVKINNVFVFEKLKVNGQCLNVDASYCIYTKEEIDKSRAQFGRIKLHYPLSIKYETLNIDNRKMSKSLGNFFTVREICEKYDPQVLRFFMLSAHYRSPLNFSAELMEASKNGLDRILTGMEKLRETEAKVAGDSLSPAEEENKAKGEALAAKYEAAMEDDFNTADAISAVFELIKLANSTVMEESSKAYVSWLKEELERLCEVLGIETEKKKEVLDAEIERMIEERQAARKAKNFALADEIRGRLLEMGIILEDTREGVKWKRA